MLMVVTSLNVWTFRILKYSVTYIFISVQQVPCKDPILCDARDEMKNTYQNVIRLKSERHNLHSFI